MTQMDREAIEAIISIEDPVLRNLRITQTYQEFNAMLCELVGGINMSWCGFATWASKTAGQFIRRDNLENAIADFMNSQDWIEDIRTTLPGVLTWFGWKVDIRESGIVNVLNETAREAANHVAQGNLLVFAELAPLYAEFIRIVSGPEEDRNTVMDIFLGHLQSHDTKNNVRLVRAFSNYYDVILEAHPKARAEKILLVNLLVGFHEQIRLDPAINSSIHAPVDQIFRKKLLGSLEGWIDASLPGVIFSLLKSFIRRKVEPVIDRMASKWREISTKELMKIEIPTGNLDLSEDIPMRTFSSHGMFPPELTTLENPELLDVLRQLDRTPDTTAGGGAGDWGSLDDRMNFICDFFRSAQQDPRLLRAPFTSEQVDALRRDVIPKGKL